MANDIVINGETYPGAESLVLYDVDGNPVQFYSSAVLYTPQELTEEQKAQARENIGSADSDTVDMITQNMFVKTEYGVNIVNIDECLLGNMVLDGGTSSSSVNKYTPKISVEPGDIVRFYRNNSSSVELKNVAFVTAFNADGMALSDLGVRNCNESYTVPAGVAFIVITFSGAYNWTFTKNQEISEPAPWTGDVKAYVAKTSLVGMASNTHPGLVRVWTENLDGEMVLHISTEEV